MLPDFCCVLHKVYVWSSEELDNDSNTHVEHPLGWNAGVLKRILAAQKLDRHGIEGIYPLFRALATREGMSETGLNSNSADSQVSKRAASLHTEQPSADSLSEDRAGLDREYCTSVGSSQEAALQVLLGLGFPAACEAIRHYLIAATAKDCSIMITLQPLDAGAAPVAESGEQANECAGIAQLQTDAAMGCVVSDAFFSLIFRYKVAIVDLDLKPLWKVEEHFTLDQKIVKNALRANATELN